MCYLWYEVLEELCPKEAFRQPFPKEQRIQKKRQQGYLQTTVHASQRFCVTSLDS